MAEQGAFHACSFHLLRFWTAVGFLFRNSVLLKFRLILRILSVVLCLGLFLCHLV